jgi:hypothetical protein
MKVIHSKFYLAKPKELTDYELLQYMVHIWEKVNIDEYDYDKLLSRFLDDSVRLHGMILAKTIKTHY